MSLYNETKYTQITLFSDVEKGVGISNIKIVVVPDASKQRRDSARAGTVYVLEKDAP
jgi:hypothetical protein